MAVTSYCPPYELGTSPMLTLLIRLVGEWQPCTEVDIYNSSKFKWENVS